MLHEFFMSCFPSSRTVFYFILLPDGQLQPQRPSTKLSNSNLSGFNSQNTHQTVTLWWTPSSFCPSWSGRPSLCLFLSVPLFSKQQAITYSSTEFEEWPCLTTVHSTQIENGQKTVQKYFSLNNRLIDAFRQKTCESTMQFLSTQKCIFLLSKN